MYAVRASEGILKNGKAGMHLTRRFARQLGFDLAKSRVIRHRSRVSEEQGRMGRCVQRRGVLRWPCSGAFPPRIPRAPFVSTPRSTRFLYICRFLSVSTANYSIPLLSFPVFKTACRSEPARTRQQGCFNITIAQLCQRPFERNRLTAE